MQDIQDRGPETETESITPSSQSRRWRTFRNTKKNTENDHGYTADKKTEFRIVNKPEYFM